RQLRDVELGMAKRPEEDLLRLQRHEHGRHTVDGNGAVEQRPHPVVVTNGDGELELRHECPLVRGTCAICTPRYLALRPAASTAADMRFASPCSAAAKPSGPAAAGSTPTTASCRTTSGSLTAARASATSLATTSGGVPERPKMPIIGAKSKPGMT